MDFLDFIMNFMFLYIVSNIISVVLIILFSYATEATLVASACILSMWLTCRITNINIKSVTKEQRFRLLQVYTLIFFTAFGIAIAISSIGR